MFKRLKLISNCREFLGWILLNTFPSLMSERLKLEMIYLIHMREHLNLSNPQTFNEKLQWLKLYDRNPLYTQLVDKFLVKDWVAKKIGGEHIIETIAVYNSPDEIDISLLPNKFVLKCTHDSGSVIICKDKSTFDMSLAKKKLADCLTKSPYTPFVEWAYKNVPHRIIAEEFMEEIGQNDLMDYKLFCFNGEPKILYMSRDHAQNCTTDFFDMDFNRIPMRMQSPNSENPPAKPKQFEELKRLASILSQGIPQVRVDFYVINEQIYFGEMTFYHCGGMVPVQPYEWNLKMGEMIKLPNKK